MVTKKRTVKKRTAADRQEELYVNVIPTPDVHSRVPADQIRQVVWEVFLRFKAGGVEAGAAVVDTVVVGGVDVLCAVEEHPRFCLATIALLTVEEVERHIAAHRAKRAAERN